MSSTLDSSGYVYCVTGVIEQVSKLQFWKPQVLGFSFCEIQLTAPLTRAPAMRIPSAGVNTGSQSLYHRSKPKGTPAERPITAIANQKKLNRTKNKSTTSARLIHFKRLFFINCLGSKPQKINYKKRWPYLQ